MLDRELGLELLEFGFALPFEGLAGVLLFSVYAPAGFVGGAGLNRGGRRRRRVWFFGFDVLGCRQEAGQGEAEAEGHKFRAPVPEARPSRGVWRPGVVGRGQLG